MIKEKAISIKGPWMCVGDFNEILYNHEKDEGRIRFERKIKGFRDMIEGSNLINLNSQRQRFTWISKREEGIIKERIDRTLVNLEWMECYPRT